jgi:hypothetical protein
LEIINASRAQTVLALPSWICLIGEKCFSGEINRDRVGFLIHSARSPSVIGEYLVGQVKNSLQAIATDLGVRCSIEAQQMQKWNPGCARWNMYFNFSAVIRAAVCQTHKSKFSFI